MGAGLEGEGEGEGVREEVVVAEAGEEEEGVAGGAGGGGEGVEAGVPVDDLRLRGVELEELPRVEEVVRGGGEGGESGDVGEEGGGDRGLGLDELAVELLEVGNGSGR